MQKIDFLEFSVWTWCMNMQMCAHSKFGILKTKLTKQSQQIFSDAN